MTLSLYPFRFHRFEPNKIVAVSSSGDYVFLNQSDLDLLVENPELLPIKLLAELKSKFFIAEKESRGSLRLLASRIEAKKELVLSGPSLHIFVPTLQCGHTCQYCQVSRSLDDVGFTMSSSQIDDACDTVFQSPSKILTIEFQGGDPLLRFDLVSYAIERINILNRNQGRIIRFVIASTLHQLTEDMCRYLKKNNVFLSTSLDGPADLHNHNRPIPTRDSYQRTMIGIELARRCLGKGSVSALMTTSKESLSYPEEIVDEYVKNGFNEIFLRPLSLYGFAKRNEHHIGYSLDEFKHFYECALNRIIYWNKKGVLLREVTASILLNKILSPFDAGYVDLQSPTGAGLSALVYNYDGYVYPSDEARMLAETGDKSLRLGKIGISLNELLNSQIMHDLIRSSLVNHVPGCMDCAFNNFCSPDPIGAKGQFGTFEVPVFWTEHCKQHMWLFDFFFRKLKTTEDEFLELAFKWSQAGCVNQSSI